MYDKNKEINIINQLSTLLAELYQFLGRISPLEEDEYKPTDEEVITYMDLIVELLNKTDVYYDENLCNKYLKQLDKKFKK